MAMRNTLSDRDIFVNSLRAASDLKAFDRSMSDDMTVKSTKQTLTAKTAPSTVRPIRDRLTNEELRRLFW